MRRAPALQPGDDVLAGDPGHPGRVGWVALPRWGTRTALSQLREGVLGVDRLLLVDVDAGPGDLPLLEGGGQGALVDDAPPGGVDQDGGGLHQGQLGPRSPPRLRGEGAVEGDEVALPEEVVQGAKVAPVLASARASGARPV